MDPKINKSSQNNKSNKISRDSVILRPLTNVKTFLCPSKFKLSFVNRYRDAYLKEYIESERTYNLNFIQRIFVTIQYPSASIISNLWENFITILIIISVFNAILASEEYFQITPNSCLDIVCDKDDASICSCPPIPWYSMQVLDSICIYGFVADFLIRILTCAFVNPRLSDIVPNNWDRDNHLNAAKNNKIPEVDPKYSPIECFIRYFLSINTLIDFCAIFPFLVPSVPDSFARVMRLFRLIKMMRNVSAGNKNFLLLTDSVIRSSETGVYVVFCVLIFTIFFGWLMNLMEGGEFIVSSEEPDGAYMRKNSEGERSISPYSSISTSIYWAAVTLTTLGYGDIYPLSAGGRFIAGFTAFIGVFFLAFPVTLLAVNFTKAAEEEKKYKILVEDKLNSEWEDLEQPETDISQNNYVSIDNNENSSDNDSKSIELTITTSNLDDIDDLNSKTSNLTNEKIISQLLKITQEYNELFENFNELNQTSILLQENLVKIQDNASYLQIQSDAQIKKLKSIILSLKSNTV